ncbi:hypothetical protein LDENG_00277600 [Lucifuga dentata]|nr:hypothetical protein LDENG_00277600 [Lucifuga dentata]
MSISSLHPWSSQSFLNHKAGEKGKKTMRVILWVMGLCVLIQESLCSTGEMLRGCRQWTPSVANVCCDTCEPGNRRVRRCGPDPKDLCTPCEPGTFTVDPQQYRCFRCSQCIGDQVFVRECTSTSDTVCGCKKGLRCGNDQCSFCVQECGKGQEPAEKRK